MCILALAALAATSMYTGRASANRGARSVDGRIEKHVHVEEGSRALSIALPDGGCEVTHAVPSATPIKPVWQASYPGSGARMTYGLIEALTGIKTNSDVDPHKAGYENVVSVKTHHPWNALNQGALIARLEDGPMSGSRAIVILRNPLHGQW